MPVFTNTPFNEEDEYADRNTGRPKRRRMNDSNAHSGGTFQRCHFQPLLDLLDVSSVDNKLRTSGHSFEENLQALLPDYLDGRHVTHEQDSELSHNGELLRTPTRYETSAILDRVGDLDVEKGVNSLIGAMTLRKLKLRREKRRANLPDNRVEIPPPSSLTPFPATRPISTTNRPVIDALNSIRTTPFENSFLSRTCGIRFGGLAGLISTDWETRSPWMDLLSDIRAHYSLAHPDQIQAVVAESPVTYTTLQTFHLAQIHDLLSRIFWEGIDVTGALDQSPEQCTVVATCKYLVVGVALLSCPQETYITYLAVRAGWENSQIATSMLYHLIMLNPNKDITLHVSANSPAMLLYNRFGFKAEEYIAGFYENYLDPQSRASKNAFRLRLRR